MTKEKKFFDTLGKIFIGAKVEGESGYINLMGIKSRYYEKGVFPKLQKDIDKALEPFPDFREELFNRLYTFFSRYFSESGSIYFSYTPLHQNIYEKVYTDDKDVMLFWKTHMLYYVKTDRLFKNLKVEVDNLKFFFDVSDLEYKRANEKKEIVYEFKNKREDGTIVFDVYYSERGKKTKIIDILRALKKEELNINEDILEKAFKIFEKQNEVDYFINKDAKTFLREQFDIWLYQYVFSGESEWSEERIKQLQILKDIAFKIIDFISQFEDELVKIWNKPKFVLNSNYVITLDRIADKNIELVEKTINHKNIDEQIKEWKELGIINNDFDKTKIIENNLMGKQLNKKYKHLPIDTKYFKDLELEILGFFDDLDNQLDGWLIKSENYQALKTILPKFKEKIQTIYIDPPFNKESDADYFYSVKYKDASWITLLENRLRLAKDILNPKGSIFVRCDYNGNMLVRSLMNEIFGEENFRNEIVISRISKQDPKAKKFNTATDSLFLYSKDEKFLFQLLFKKLSKAKSERWHAMDSQGQGQPLYIFGCFLEPPKRRHWTYGQKNIKQMEAEGKIRLKCKNCEHIHYSGIWAGCPNCGNKNNIKIEYFLAPTEEKQVDSNWTDISGYTSNWNFPTENSEILLKRTIKSTSCRNNLIIDFFLGSGTTTAVAHKLKRKWIGVEMGEHVRDVILPRMKKVLSYDKSGISKEKDVKEIYNPQNAGGFFKYYELEQYEDTLRKVKYEDSDLFNNPYVDSYNQYVFMRDSKMLEALEIDYKNNKVKVDLSKLYKNIDIPETLSNLLGKWIKKITPDYVEFENGEKIEIKNLDYKLIKSLIWW
ncbi:MAG TPA: site-specific DNA-methyltransferase [Candidatus Atribacteria bacterium]|nr:site-specific DNA-methyltransferase [Candidatus Atribacteria bacterium]